jgi:hypothetical protein
MRQRPVVSAVLLLGLLGACTRENRPSPRDPSAHYAVEIIFCDRKLQQPSDTCNGTHSVTGANVFANVIVRDAATHVIQVEMDGPQDGTYRLDPTRIPADEGMAQWLEISRASSCSATPCTVAINVYIDDGLVSTDSVTFI